MLTATASTSTLNVGDLIDGKAGTDTLKLIVDTVGAPALPVGLQVSNVENIEITNGGSLAAPIDASTFVGATTIKQIASAVNVQKLAATTTAAFASIETAGLTVSADAAAASANVALDKVKGTQSNNVVTLNVAADATNTALAAVNVSGNIVQKDTTQAAAAIANVNETFTVTFASAFTAGQTLIFDGVTYTTAEAANAAAEAAAFVAAYNSSVAPAPTWTASATGAVVTFVKAGAQTNVTSAAFTGTGTARIGAPLTTQEGVTAVGATTAAAAASLALNATLGKDVQAATVNTAVKTTLTIDNAAGSTKSLTSVDASASAGDITYTTAGLKVATIKTGAGKDVVEIRTATSNVAGAVVDALVDTGAGDDKITVLTTGTGKTTVNAGAGNDSILIGAAGVGSLTTSTIIDGGDGTDTLSLAGKTLVAEDYVLFNSVVKNVEAVEFTTATAAVVDASKLAFTAYTFAGNAGDTVTAASAAALTTKGALTAVATGYKADVATDGDVLTDAYGGALNITSVAGNGAVKASGSEVNLTVKAAAAANNAVVLTGDAQTAKVTLTNNGSVVADDQLASVSITIAAAPNVLGTASDVTGNSYLTSLTLSGNGSAVVNNASGAKLATIDASALGGTYAFGADAGFVTDGLTFAGSAAVAETIKLGSGKDVLTIASTYDKMDTIEGFDAKKETADLKSVTDTIIFGGVTLNGAAASQATKVTLSAAATSLDLAFVEAAAANTGAGVSFFQFGGNTYLFQDAAVGGSTAGLDATDLAVKIVGTVDFAAAWGVYAAV